MKLIGQVLWGCLALAFGAPVAAPAGADGGEPSRSARPPYCWRPRAATSRRRAAPYRTEAMLKQAAPTSQWYSTLIFNAKPEADLRPAAELQDHARGPRDGAAAQGGGCRPTLPPATCEIAYPHADPLVFSPLAFEPEPAKLAACRDWAVDIAMARGADQLLATVAHGSPYAYFQLSRGDLRIRLPAAGRAPGRRHRRAPSGAAREGASYAMFGPTGVRWEQVSPTEWVGRLPEGKGYFSAAALPDDKPETLALLARHAYAFVTDTTVGWKYDAAAARWRPPSPPRRA